MRLLIRVLLSALLTLTFSASAMAETRVVAAGRASTILFWSTYVEDTCATGSKPKPRVTKEPEHGTLSFEWQALRMGKGAGNCAGKLGRGMRVTYRPHKGYRGTDTVKFSLGGSGVYPGASYSLGRGFSYEIIVK
jgi:hypothetical protein